MPDWLNHVTVLTTAGGSHTVDPSNPTASGTVKDGVAFTPTAGRFLLCVVAGPVTSTTPTGWTLPTGGSSVNTDGVYAFYKTAAGSDTVATTHNSSAFQVTFDFYEFQSGSAFASAAAFFSSSGASDTLSGLSGTNLVMTAVASPSTAGTWAFTGATAAVDYDTGSGGSHHYGLAYTKTTASSAAVAASLSTHEQVMVALTGTTPPDATVTPPTATATATAPVPSVTADSLVSPTATATAQAYAPTWSQTLEVATDTSNAREGRQRNASATVTIARPVVPMPPTLTLAHKVDKAIAYPDPVMDDGRPT